MSDHSEFKQELKEFIKLHKNDKIYNDAIDPNIYNKILDRITNNKRTNVRAITSVNKLCQYYLAAKMIGKGFLDNDIEDYVGELASNYLYEFKQMFSEVERETPEYRILKHAKVTFENEQFYIDYKGNKYEAKYDSDMVTYDLLPANVRLSLNASCWGSCCHRCDAPIGSITLSVPWDIHATVKYNKNTNDFLIENVRFYSTYELYGLSLVARYTGLGHNSAWINEFNFGTNKDTTYRNVEWEEGHDSVTRGKVYIFHHSNNIASIQGDWDGYYNNISFDKFKTLLERTI